MSESEAPPEETRLQAFAFDTKTLTQPQVQWHDRTGDHSAIVEGKIVVGSSAGSGVVIADDTVSRLHAELEVRDDGLWLRDLGSRNGSFVNGIQVSGCRVPDDGTIRLGGAVITVDYASAGSREIELWPTSSFQKLVGSSARMRELFATLARIAASDAPVLIHGETGTGKELVARAIHDSSPRAAGPLVVVDCAALPEALLDSELFGHARGSFTGAISDREGAIESADGGTVFLDEIGELPLAMQPKLLRVLEQHTVRRVGEANHRKVDVRFVSATHRDLLRMVNAGEFREDLYFRLCVIPVDVPPLRERPEDIELLVNHFLTQVGNSGRLSPDLMREVASRPWRGNVRELRNFVERACALGPQEALAMTRQGGTSSGRVRTAAPLSTRTPLASVAAAAPASPAVASTSEGMDAAQTEAMFGKPYRDFRDAWVDAGEKAYLKRLLLKHDRNVLAAAKEADVDRTHLYRLIRKHEL